MQTRKIELNNNQTLEIIQDLQYGYAGEVWDGALVFTNSAKLEKFQNFFPFKNTNILELGSGTGICGLLLATLNPENIIITDKKESLPLINKNLEKNFNLFNINTKISIQELLWENKDQIEILCKENLFDYIICSDIIYNRNTFQYLYEIFEILTKKNHTKIIFSYTFREEIGWEFFEYFKENSEWEIKKIPEDLIHEDYVCEDIVLLCARKII